MSQTMTKTNELANTQPHIWHYGLVANYWAEFHHDGPEIAYFQNLIEQYGQPTLIVGCGTGRLLRPYLRAGIDVDGSDISAEMLAHCRRLAEQEGLSPVLNVQANHELNLPRRYQTIVVCGCFGIGATREQDVLALQRFYHHLAPGGVLLLENYMPYEGSTWARWQKESRDEMSKDFWFDSGERKTASDGSVYAQFSRYDDIDPFEQSFTMRMRTEQRQNGELIAQEERVLTSNMYFKNELLLRLEQAGFIDITMQGDFKREVATRDHKVVVFVARKS